MFQLVNMESGHGGDVECSITNTLERKNLGGGERVSSALAGGSASNHRHRGCVSSSIFTRLSAGISGREDTNTHQVHNYYIHSSLENVYPL